MCTSLFKNGGPHKDHERALAFQLSFLSGVGRCRRVKTALAFRRSNKLPRRAKRLQSHVLVGGTTCPDGLTSVFCFFFPQEYDGYIWSRLHPSFCFFFFSTSWKAYGLVRFGLPTLKSHFVSVCVCMWVRRRGTCLPLFTAERQRCPSWRFLKSLKKSGRDEKCETLYLRSSTRSNAFLRPLWVVI